ncbi:hypothetical protein HOLleu_28223 [Holothuria leucospilota]|uniref:Uncharacterized protein n=1 Tax=Holothuria leucospilota TaxID=206669 RepID=A0A9Q1BLR6_HOLLE|nr:hypothetical protein HOLleu_28223 [Holothuria leucospilota]
MKLSSPERSVLSKGLNFVPLNPLQNEFSIRRDVSSFCRRLRLRLHFGDSDETDNTSSEDVFRSFQSKRSPWTPKPSKSKVLDSVIESINSDLERLLPPNVTPFRNISLEERKALLSLKKNMNFIIKPADKGSATVVGVEIFMFLKLRWTPLVKSKPWSRKP